MTSHPAELTTADFTSLQSRDAALLVDVRPVEAYNGWALRGEARGGHIEGAISFPYGWSRYRLELHELLAHKGLTRDRSIVLYGYERGEAEQMAEALREAGFADVRCYHSFVNEWSAGMDMPMARLKRYDRLVSPQWVQQLIDGERPSGYEGERFVICHSHYDYLDDYHKGHIPGSIPLNTNALESPEDWNRRSSRELQDALQEHGIAHDTTVVMCGRFSFPNNYDPYPGRAAGHLGAIRSAVIMMYAGVRDVRVLNGGLTRWEEAGLPLTTEPSQPTPITEFGREIPAHPEIFVDTPEAKKLLASEDGDLVSVRSWPEFIGKVSGYNYIEKKGRIPGAIFGNCGSDAYHMENYRNLDYTTRDYHEIERAWAEAGITADKHLAFYCGTGWRGSEAFFNAYLMGWPRVSVYDGGWMEWSSDPDNPIGTGEPETAGTRCSAPAPTA